MKKNWWKILLSILGGGLAIYLVCMLLFILFFVHPVMEDSDLVTVDGGYWNPLMNSLRGIETSFNGNDNMTFEVEAIRGAFFQEIGPSVKNATVRGSGYLAYDGYVFLPWLHWIDVVIKEDGKIIGYAVIQLMPAGFLECEGSILQCRTFPEVDGKPQNVDQATVQWLLFAAKWGWV